VITKGKKDILPYNVRNNENVGKFHGVGISSSYGTKRGGYTDIDNPHLKPSKDAPSPRKFN